MEQKGLDFGSGGALPPGRRRALSVSELTERLQGLIEVEFFDLWVEGEISNLKLATSGHWYFSLKDDAAQLRCVVWKTAARLIRFRPKDGMKVLARGGLRLYPPRGEYQLSVEVLEPLGKGALQQAFEELKQLLSKEGLFDEARKRRLPMLPRRIGIVTSPTGAVIRDILHVLAQRYANLEIVVYPARVQGTGAAQEIVQGIRALNRYPGLDVLIVARGGGSIEDLWPFNEEPVARALAASRVPTISAVGHETDFTIADFVADVRAPTPSAAAERVVQAKEEIRAKIDALARRQELSMSVQITRIRARLEHVTSHAVFEAERGRVRRQAERVEEWRRRGEVALRRAVERSHERLRRQWDRVEAFRWDRQIGARRERLGSRLSQLTALVRTAVRMRRNAWSEAVGKLDSLSPLSVLGRGYALIWDAQGRLVRAPHEVSLGDALRVRVSGGEFGATVSRKEPS